jgi:hypothetical protein
MRLYTRAAAAIKVDCPTNTDMEWDYFRPRPKKWLDLESLAWQDNQPAFALAREARSLRHARFPANGANPAYSEVRRLAVELCDAAVYRHLEHDDAEAVELIRDVLHMGKLLRTATVTPGDATANGGPVALLVGAGLDAVAMSRFTEIVADVELSDDPANKHAMQVKNARAMIATLLDDQKTPADALRAVLGDSAIVDTYVRPKSQAGERLIEALNRQNMERTLAAMSLASHVFRFDHNRWPKSLDEVTPAYLPRVPVDPWGDGKQTYGYALLVGALPDGGDRPLVYARCASKDGLRYRVDGPFYDIYSHDGSNRIQSLNLEAGQFRDVARWSPTERLPTDDRPHMRAIEAAPGL